MMQSTDDTMPNNTPIPNDAGGLIEVVIPRENAVFWMDDQGRWCNCHGRFEHRRIIDYFNKAIERDENGYFVTQVRGDIREKVYFPHGETPLFVVQVAAWEPPQLTLNTGRLLPLDPHRLFVHADRLYLRMGDEIARFNDRALMAMMPYLDETDAGMVVRIGKTVVTLPEETP